MATHESRLKITLLDQVTGRARGISAALGGIERQASSFSAPFRSLGGQLLAFGGAYLGVTKGMQATAGAAISFESAFADVRKVVDANDEQLDNMRRTIRKMSGELPIAANDIAALFAAAGESGIATADLKTFAEMAARVGIAFDMTAGAAGESLAKLKTQLGLSVAETGDMADAINHLSNNMASKAKDITAYMLRVGALAEMGGFTKEQIAGIGSAMIAAGAEAETAGTAMQNVVKALTKGASAKKSQREVAAALGLDLPQLAKDMQKDAPRALRKVLAAIAKTPKDRHLALLSDFFGDEAKAFAPLIGNMGLLEQALDSVSDKTKYSGSAFREYVERSQTAANALQILRNKIANVFWAMGDRMLPTIKEGAAAIGDILDSLGSRVSIFDKVTTGIKGFMNGLGYAGIREVIDDLGDLFFGKVDANAGDQLGEIFMKAKGWGAAIRELSAAIAENPIARFFASLAPYGLQIAAWGVGIALLAGTIRKLASALIFLSGASAIVGAFKVVKNISNLLPKGRSGAAPETAKPASRIPGGRPGSSGPWGKVPTGGNLPSGARVTPTGPKISTPGAAPVSSWGGALKGGLLTWLLTELGTRGIRSGMQKAYGDKYVEPPSLTESFKGTVDAWKNLLGDKSFWLGKAADPNFDSSEHFKQGIKLDAADIDAIAQPRGTQDVNVLNPPPAPNINLTVTIPVTGVTNPEDLANRVSSLVGQRLRDEVAGIYADTGYGVA